MEFLFYLFLEVEENFHFQLKFEHLNEKKKRSELFSFWKYAHL